MNSTARERAGIDAIASRLLVTREALGLNQRQLCERTGIAPNTYNQWEKARGRPDLDGALALCDALGLTLDWIYRGDPSGLPYGLASRLLPEALERPQRRVKRGGDLSILSKKMKASAFVLAAILPLLAVPAAAAQAQSLDALRQRIEIDRFQLEIDEQMQPPRGERSEADKATREFDRRMLDNDLDELDHRLSQSDR